MTPAERLAASRLYLCTDSRRRQRDLPAFLDAVLAAGVDIVQLREKHLEAAEELDLLAVFADAARRHDRLLAVNDRADIAATIESDILHLGQRDLSPAAARRLVASKTVLGVSTHSAEQFDRAIEDPDIAYACVGPVWATPTKPGREPTGLDLVSHAARRRSVTPWFAIGGIDERSIDQVLAAGATRVVVVRAITEAEHPGSAVRALLDRMAAARASEPARMP